MGGSQQFFFLEVSPLRSEKMFLHIFTAQHFVHVWTTEVTEVRDFNEKHQKCVEEKKKTHIVTYFHLNLQSVSTQALLGSIYTVCSLCSVLLHPEGREQLLLPLTPVLLFLLFQ